MTSNVFHYEVGKVPSRAVSAKGCRIVDADGATWLDAGAGAGAATLGYGLAEVVDAITEQAAALPYAYGRHFTTTVQEELASLLVEIAPGDMQLAYFVTGGSEANESAIKIARQYHVERGALGKHIVLSRFPGYHGNTVATLSLSGRPSWSTPFTPMLTSAPQVPAPYGAWNRVPGHSDGDFARMCAADLEKQILRSGPDSVAAFIAEPIIGGSAPAAAPPDEYWPLVREVCDRHDVLLIVDEVFAGFGRTGRDFGIQHWDVAPDMITCGKGISGGYAPLGAVMVNARIAEGFAGGSGVLKHSFTYAGHPLSCAAGLAAVRYLRDHQLSARSAELGNYLYEQLQPLNDHPLVTEIRGGKGLLAGIQFSQFDELAPVPGVAAQLIRYAAARHVLLTPATNGDQIQLMPPLVSDKSDLDEIVAVIGDGLDSIKLPARTDIDA